MSIASRLPTILQIYSIAAADIKLVYALQCRLVTTTPNRWARQSSLANLSLRNRGRAVKAVEAVKFLFQCIAHITLPARTFFVIGKPQVGALSCGGRLVERGFSLHP